jgi:hypothetical protein
MNSPLPLAAAAALRYHSPKRSIKSRKSNPLFLGVGGDGVGFSNKRKEIVRCGPHNHIENKEENERNPSFIISREIL